jgi:hypothetical protein
MRSGASIGRVSLLLTAGLVLQQCSSQSAPEATPAAAAAPSDTSPVLSVKELMEHIVDPTADYIFDAAVIDISEKGVTETKPLTDEDWLKIERGAYLLAESTNLLKMPRPMVPPGTVETPAEPGKPGPELTGPEIEAKIKENRALWNSHADALRQTALDAVKIVKARDAEALFDVGSRVDKACEGCHLDYWYPGDRAAVLADEQKKVTYDPPKK